MCCGRSMTYHNLPRVISFSFVLALITRFGVLLYFAVAVQPGGNSSSTPACLLQEGSTHLPYQSNPCLHDAALVPIPLKDLLIDCSEDRTEPCAMWCGIRLSNACLSQVMLTRVMTLLGRIRLDFEYLHVCLCKRCPVLDLKRLLSLVQI